MVFTMRSTNSKYSVLNHDYQNASNNLTCRTRNLDTYKFSSKISSFAKLTQFSMFFKNI